MADRCLSKAELDHLEWALLEVRRTGSYYGNHSAFVRRQARLEQWTKDQRPNAPKRAKPMDPKLAAIYHGDIDGDFNY